jgi:ABC-type antimicrobial peptide transport system permease subunit
MRAAAVAALARLRLAPGRTALLAAGILAAAAMAGAAVTVAYGLSTGFDRAAREADLPDVLVRFSDEPQDRVERIIRALPNVQAVGFRSEIENVDLASGFERSRRGVVQAVRGRRGYAVVEGRDVSGRPREAVLERGVAREWHLAVGDEIDVGRLGPLRIVGIGVAPDNVAFPLASAPRVYVSRDWVERDLVRGEIYVNQALVWANDPDRVDVLLQQARATSFGISDVRFLTRQGVRVLIDQAAGVVIALLVAFSLVALGAAGLMLAAGARADVQRRLQTIGVQRAIGVGRGLVAAEHGLTAAVVAVVAGAAGLALGALVARGPATRLLEALNEQPPGAALLLPLAATLAAIVAVVTFAAAWPAWRAAGRAPVDLLRGAELATGRPPRRRAAKPGAARRPPGGGTGALALGARLALARRGRALGTVAVLAVCSAVVLLMLGLASLVERLRDDPGSVGKRYDLTVRLEAEQVGAVRAIAGVEAAAPRYVVRGADSFSLGEPVKLIAFGGDHTPFEDPPLAEGRRVRSDAEAEVGVGLAQALGLRVGGALAVQLPDGEETRFRVVGLVRALDDDGRLAYVRPGRLLAASPGLGSEIVVRLAPGADGAAVRARLTELGARPSAVGGATTRNGAFLAVLASLLRAVAAVDALVCLYALVQALALTARERRPTLSVLRATGAGAGTVGAVLAGAALVVAVPAALGAFALQRWVLAPVVADLAAGYADLESAVGYGAAAAAASGLLALALLAAAWTARRVVSEPPVAGLREE